MPLSNFNARPTIAASRVSILWTIVLACSALIIALFVISYLRDEEMDWLPSLLFGATVGVMVVWVLFRSIWIIIMRVTRGAPFRISDRVEITKGEHQGAVGKVNEVLEGRYAVRVVLDSQANPESTFIFNWNELRKVKMHRN